MSKNVDRREFLETIGMTAAGIATAGFTATSKGYYANETINVATIGSGGRCQHIMKAVPQVQGLKLVGVCDVWDERIASAKKLADPQAFESKDYRAVLDRKDVDAVLIASPDHWHVPMTIDACAAGKDVYVEKPLTHDLSEGAAVIEAQNNYKKIVQVGTQQRSMPQFKKGLEIVQSGKLGKIHKVHLQWNRNRGWAYGAPVDQNTIDWKKWLGPAKERPFDGKRVRGWRWYWDYGGGILTDLMVHHMDIVCWYLGLGDPSMATAIGDYFQKERHETPDTIQMLAKYPDKELEVHFEGTFSNARNASMVEFMGTEGTLYADRGRCEFYPENKKGKPEDLVLGDGPKGADFYLNPDGEALHLANWLECIRSRNKPICPAEGGVAATLAPQLGNLAFRSGQVVKWEDRFKVMPKDA